MLSYDKITWLHAEITNKCNAWCPGCSRNNNGYGLKDGLRLTSLNPSRFIEILNLLPNLKTVQMCGTYGDPIASEFVQEIIDISIERNLRIRIHTNGSLKTADWWSNLAKKLTTAEHDVIFGLDGLEDTHSIYRQGTNFNKIINNAKAFIDSGGNAEWQFLLFKHNVHQVKDCIKMSQKLGFKKFTAKKSIRIPKPARNYQTGEIYEIEPDTKFSEVHNNGEKILTSADCMHLNLPSIYLNADGSLTPCCYLTDVDYNANMIDEEITQSNPNDRCKNLCGRVTVGHKN